MRFFSRPDSYRDFPRPQDTHGSLTNEIPRRFALLGMTLVVLLVFYRLRDTFVIPNASEESQSQTIPRIQLNRGNPVGWRFLDADVTFILWGFRRFTPVFIFLRKWFYHSSKAAFTSICEGNSNCSIISSNNSISSSSAKSYKSSVSSSK